MRTYEAIFAYFLLILLGVSISVVAWGYPGDSGYFPLAVGLTITLLAVIGTARLKNGSSDTYSDDEAPFPQAAVGLAIFAVYLIIANYMGFLTSALLFIPALAAYGGVRRPFFLLISSAGFVAIMFVLFVEIFSRPLPSDLIFSSLR